MINLVPSMIQTELLQKILFVNQMISNIAIQVGRDPQKIKVLAATKGQSIEVVNSYIKLVNSQGYKAYIGESYLQELDSKLPYLEGDFELHFIGRLQSNKVKQVLSSCTAVQSIGNTKHLKLLLLELAKLTTSSKKSFFLQFNVSEDPKKAGFSRVDLPEIKLLLSDSKFIDFLLGVMTITESYFDNFDETAGAKLIKKDYHKLALISAELSSFVGRDLEISMGMSDDFELAIAEGSTMIRIGSGFFGE
jgi:PLP dependent protein